MIATWVLISVGVLFVCLIVVYVILGRDLSHVSAMLDEDKVMHEQELSDMHVVPDPEYSQFEDNKPHWKIVEKEAM